jgi:AcrR family transcriptional regulator
VTSVTGEMRPQRADARRNRARILEAAQTVFAAKGSSAGVDEVATAAGVGVGTLYRHFPTKEDLIAAILFERMRQLIVDGQAYLEAEDPDQGLREFLTHVVDESLAKQDLVDALGGGPNPSMAPDPPPEVVEIAANLNELTGQLLARAQEHGSIRPDVTVGDLVGLVMGPCMACGSPLIAAPSPHKMLSVVFDGLTQPARGRPLPL